MSLEELDTYKENIGHGMWVEKYRPASLKSYIGNNDFKQYITNSITKGEIEHTLLHGGAGTGKTSSAKILVRSIACDHIYINASDERGIDDIRGKVKDFASSMGFNPLKVIILDEADALTFDAQSMLRAVTEEYSKHCRFIMTCNYVQKIIPALRSRFEQGTFEIIPPNKKDVAVHLALILKNEGVQFDPQVIKTIIDMRYPDIRAVIGLAQKCSGTKTLILPEKALKNDDDKSKIVESLKVNKSNSLTEIRQIVANSHLQRFEEFYTYLFTEIDSYTNEGNFIEVLQTLEEHQFHDSFVPDKTLCFVSCIATILEKIK